MADEIPMPTPAELAASAKRNADWRRLESKIRPHFVAILGELGCPRPEKVIAEAERLQYNWVRGVGVYADFIRLQILNPGGFVSLSKTLDSFVGLVLRNGFDE